MKIEVHESALNAIKAMGQRDKERIEYLEKLLQNVSDALREDHFLPGVSDAIDRYLLVNPYSTAIIQKAE